MYLKAVINVEYIFSTSITNNLRNTMLNMPHNFELNNSMAVQHFFSLALDI